MSRLNSCKNCGAPLKWESGIARCEYCGSEFTDVSEARAKLNAAKLAAAQEMQTRELILTVNATLVGRK